MSTPPEDPSFDPAEALRMIRDQQDHARTATEPDARALYLVWGFAWLVGHLCLWTSVTGGASATGVPAAWAFWVFFGCLAAAVVFTIVHTTVRTAGTRGVSARAGAMYGWSWMLGFLAWGPIIGGLARAGAPDEVIGIAANALACVIVGLLYLGGGACFQDRSLFVLGTWILLVGAAASLAGLPGTYLVMAFAGGGGFLVMAAVVQLLLVRRRRSHEEVHGG